MEEIKEKRLEGYPNTISYQCTKTIINQMENCICKFSNGIEQGTGFFCKIPIPNDENELIVFITNNHVINEEMLNKKKQKIELKIRGEKKLKILNLDERLKYTNETYDITIIEIKESDQFRINNYLNLDDEIVNDITEDIDRNYDYEGETIYTIQYPDGELSVSYGVLKKISQDNPFTFHHLCSTKSGSSGSPILNTKNKVIGVHRGAVSKKNENLGSFLNYPIKEFIRNNFKSKVSNIYKSFDKETECDSNIDYNINENKYANKIAFNEFKDSVNAVLILSDNRLCACSSDCSIKVFDVQKSNFDLKIDKINAHSDKIWCIEEIKKNILASGGKNDIKIWRINNNALSLIKSINSAHSDYLNKIIKLDNNEFASCSRDGKVKIWSENYNEKKCINAHNTYVNSILKLNNGLLVSGSNGEGALKFWNLQDFSLYKVFKNIYATAYNNSLLEFDNMLFVGEKDGIGIFLLENNIKSFFYKNKELERILSLCYIGNNIIAAGSTNGNIYLYKIIKKPNLIFENMNIFENNLNEIKEEFYHAISGVTFYKNKFNKSYIISCSIDGLIKMHELNKNES